MYFFHYLESLNGDILNIVKKIAKAKDVDELLALIYDNFGEITDFIDADEELANKMSLFGYEPMMNIFMVGPVLLNIEREGKKYNSSQLKEIKRSLESKISIS